MEGIPFISIVLGFFVLVLLVLIIVYCVRLALWLIDDEMTVRRIYTNRG